MTHEHATLTFIIAARNAAPTIAQTLRSLVCQTRPDWLAVVIDDGSTDETASAAASVGDPRIRVEVRPPRGVAAARNLGLSMASTPLVCFVDADDTLEPQHAACLIAAIGSHDAVACGFRYTGPCLEPTGWEHTPTNSDTTLDALCELNQFALGAVVFRRNTLRDLSDRLRTGVPALFSTRTHHEDWEMLLRLAASGATWAPVVAETLYNYRLLPGSRTTALRPLWQDGLSLIRRFHPSPRAADDACRRWTLRSLARAAVAADESLCVEMLAALNGLVRSDTDTLAGSIRWGVRRLRASKDPASRGEFLGWQGAVARRLGATPLALDATRRGFESARDWASVAHAAIEQVKPGQTLVIYGLGRNGREVVAALPGHRVPLAFIDDRSDAACHLPRIAPDDLGPQHVVLITPDVRDAILSRLARRPVAAVLLPERLTPIHASDAA